MFEAEVTPACDHEHILWPFVMLALQALGINATFETIDHFLDLIDPEQVLLDQKEGKLEIRLHGWLQ